MKFVLFNPCNLWSMLLDICLSDHISHWILHILLCDLCHLKPACDTGVTPRIISRVIFGCSYCSSWPAVNLINSWTALISLYLALYCSLTHPWRPDTPPHTTKPSSFPTEQGTRRHCHRRQQRHSTQDQGHLPIQDGNLHCVRAEPLPAQRLQGGKDYLYRRLQVPGTQGEAARQVGSRDEGQILRAE